MQVPRGRTQVLLLEDEPIIALDIEGILTDAGFDVVATLSTCAGAMDWLKQNLAEVALLDIDLQDGSCELVVQRLTDLTIPFVVFSGSSPKDDTLDPMFLTGGWLEKPARADSIVAAVQAAAASAS